jgi:hypothetical protein
MTWDEAAGLYAAGASLREVAGRMGCDKKTARRHLAAAGVPIRPRTSSAPTGLADPHPIRGLVTPGVWLERYVVNGESLTSLARWAADVTGRTCHPEVIRKILQEQGIAIRTPAQQLRLDFHAGRLQPTCGHAGRQHTPETRARIAAAMRTARRKRRKCKR